MLLKKLSTLFVLISFSYLSFGNDSSIIKRNDSLTLAQAYINLSLTSTYFDSLSTARLSKILAFEEAELKTITDTGFISSMLYLYNYTKSLLFANQLKLQHKNNAGITRAILLKWKKDMDTVTAYFNNAKLNAYFSNSEYDSALKSFNVFIGFEPELVQSFKRSINQQKQLFTKYFNEDIYADFKRLFYEGLKTGKFKFDSLSYFSNLYNLPLDTGILMNKPDMKYRPVISPTNFRIDTTYRLDIKLDLMVRYMQLKAVALNKKNTRVIKDRVILYNSYENFKEDLLRFSPDGLPDNFFSQEINDTTTKQLFLLLQKKYPYKYDDLYNPKHLKMASLLKDNRAKYYFPNLAPFPSAYKFIPNFSPQRRSLLEIDIYLSSILNNSGYKGHLHYYYVQTGYAMTTSLERINKDGSIVTSGERWKVGGTGNSSFSFYQVFKSIFFETESSFRIFAFIVSPTRVAMQSGSTSIGTMQDLLENSYNSLPADLQTVMLPNKTLSILVYQFVQSDIGEVPMLEIKNALPVDTHLKKSNLFEIVTNR